MRPAFLLFSTLAIVAFGPDCARAQVDDRTYGEAASSQPSEEQILSNQAANIFFLMQGTEGVEVEDIFSAQFLTAVPAAQLTLMFDQIQQQFGPVLSVYAVERTGPYRARVSFRFETAVGSGDLVLNPAAPHRIEGLLLNDFEVTGDEIGAIKADLEALPGEVGVYFGSLDGSYPRLEINADTQLAIGSTFKLYVLSALTREMEEDNGRYWDEIFLVRDVCLQTRCEKTGRSFPSGIIQDWPAPLPMTIQSLATLMISQSDNTATDALIEYLTEERVVREMIESGHSAPQLNQPFLTTQQMFKLKASSDDVIEAYRKADLEEKYEIAWAAQDREITQDDVNASFAAGPRAIDIEWFASAHDLRRLLAYIPQDKHGITRQILAIQPSVSPKAAANYGPIFYKGGSEPGVLNYTWLLRSIYGWEVLTMSWNNPDAVLGEGRFHFLAQRLLALPPQAYGDKSEVSVPLALEVERP